LGIYLLSLSAHSILLLFSGDQEFSLGGRNGGEVNY